MKVKQCLISELGSQTVSRKILYYMNTSELSKSAGPADANGHFDADLVIDCEAREIMHLVASVRPSVCLLALSRLNRLPV